MVSDLFQGSIAARQLVATGVPVKDASGRVVYVVSAGLTPDSIRDVLLHQGLPSHWIAAITDRRGRIVGRTHEQERFIGAEPRAALLEKMRASEQGVEESVTLDGTPVVSVFSRAPASGWTVVVGIPRDSLEMPLRRRLTFTATLALLILASGMGAAWLLGSRIVRSVERLSTAADDLGHGRKVQVGATAFREAEQLGYAMEHASRRLLAAHADLLESESRLRAIIETAMDAIVVTDGGLKILMFNPAAERLFGLDRQEVLGCAFDALLPPETRAAAVGRLPGGGATTGRHTAELTVRREDETQVPVEFTATSVEVGDARFHAFMLRDLREQIRTHQALVQSNLDLQQFAFVASHDMRSPLRSIKGFITVVQGSAADRLSETETELLGRASRAVDHLDALTSDLLAYARLGDKAREHTDVPLDEVLDEVRVLLAAQASETGARIESSGLPRVRGDRSQFTQLLGNLVSNALKFRAPGASPCVRLHAHRRGAWWVIGVTDEGIGIAPEHAARIFEIFQRLHSRARYPGTGIGLAICKRIVESHGGSIWLESAEGKGSTFYFSLPAAKDAS